MRATSWLDRRRKIVCLSACFGICKNSTRHVAVDTWPPRGFLHEKKPREPRGVDTLEKEMIRWAKSTPGAERSVGHGGQGDDRRLPARALLGPQLSFYYLQLSTEVLLTSNFWPNLSDTQISEKSAKQLATFGSFCAVSTQMLRKQNQTPFVVWRDLQDHVVLIFLFVL